MRFLVDKLLSNAVMTNSYVYYLRNLRSANLLRTQRKNFSMRPQHVRMMREPLSFDVSDVQPICRSPETGVTT